MNQLSVYGIVPNRKIAEETVQELIDRGIPKDDISFLFAHEESFHVMEKDDSSHDIHTKAPEGAVAGITAGGILGGALGLLIGMGALAIPGAAPFILAGPIISTLSGIGAGGTVGGIIGALTGMEIPEREAKELQDKIAEGAVVIAIFAPTEIVANTAEEILINHGADDVNISSETKMLHHHD